MDLTNVRIVGKHSIVPVHIEYMKDLTLEKNPMNVIIVENLSPLTLTFLCTRESIIGGFDYNN